MSRYDPRAKERHGAAPCSVVLFRDRPTIGPNTVLYIDNRPGREHAYEAAAAGMQTQLTAWLEAGDAPEALRELSSTALPEDKRQARHLRGILDAAIRDKEMRDTRRVSEWIGILNDELTPAEFPSLELMVAHAESHVHNIYAQLSGAAHVRPAAIVLSGSPKMLEEVLTTPVIQATIMLCQYALRHNIPIFGICFGLHLLVYARHGILPDWLTVPPGVGILESVQHPEGGLEVRPGQRLMAFGPQILRRRKHCPITNGMSHAEEGLAVHSQGYVLNGAGGLPEEDVLADVHRNFRSPPHVRNQHRVEQSIAAVVQLGRYAFACQHHPELMAVVMYVATFFPGLHDALILEGQKVARVRERLRGRLGHDERVPAQKVGFNWVTRVLGPNWVDHSTQSGRLDRDRFKAGSARLRHLRWMIDDTVETVE